MKQNDAVKSEPLPAATVLDDHFTPEALAHWFHITRRTIDRWDVLRIGPPRIVVGRTILYKKSSVEQWLASREEKPVSSNGRNQRRARRTA
jgi:hypothetical protein